MKPGGVPHRHSFHRRQRENQQDIARRGWALRRRQALEAQDAPLVPTLPRPDHPSEDKGILPWMGVAVGLAVAVAIALVVYGAVTDDDNDRATVDASSTSAPASAGDGDAIATIGDSGDVVTEIQRLLRDTWGYDVAVDGSYGTQTATAVAAFQAEHGLPANGVVDEATYDALSEEPGPDSTAPQPSSGVPQTGPPPTEVADE